MHPRKVIQITSLIEIAVLTFVKINILIKPLLIFTLLSIFLYDIPNPLLSLRFILRILDSMTIRKLPCYFMYNITWRCNSRCSYCSFWKIKDHKELDTEGAKEIIKRIRDLGGVFLVLSGGEPTLRNDLEELVSFARKNGILVGISSNGTLLNREKAKRLIDLGVNNIVISLDTLDKEKYRKIRGIDALDIVLNNLSEISKIKRGFFQWISIMTVISNENKDELEKILEFARKNKIGVFVQPYNPIRAENDKLFMSPEELGRIAKKLIRLKVKGYPLKNSFRYFVGMVKYYCNLRNTCLAGRLYLVFDPLGEISPCVDCKNFYCVEKCLKGESRNPKGCWFNCTGETESSISLSGVFLRVLESTPIVKNILARYYEKKIDEILENYKKSMK